MNEPLAFFTIVARNYLAFAIRLGETVREQHPGASFTIWLLDPGETPAVPDGVTIRAVSEAVAADELETLHFYYDILELATAVKPRCFQRLFAEGAARVIYLDPDIELFAPLATVEAALDEGASGVVTPHVLAPLGTADAKPDDLEILQSGIYNLGFLALAAGSESSALLDWWWGWLRTQCFVDKSRGTFTDQKWINFAPLFWPSIHVLRDTSCNVAYWNLPQRALTIDGEGYRVDGRPLTFFHYSGLDPERPEVLSKHQTRLDVRRGTALARILAGYAGRILSLGHRELRAIEPPRAAFSNGVPLDPIARHAFRAALAEGHEFPRPQELGLGSFFSWLGRPVGRDAAGGSPRPITRYAMAIYNMRVDLRDAFPDLFQADRDGFLGWVEKRAVDDLGAAPELLAIALGGGRLRPDESDESEDPDERAAPSHSRVNLAGYLRAALGLGEAARGYARAMEAVGIEVARIDTTSLCSSPRTGESEGDTRVPQFSEASVNVIHVNADQLLHFHETMPRDFFRGRYNVGIWAWETLEFPEEWHDRFALLDEIWVGSRFIADALAPVSPLPVVVVPHVVEVPELAPDRARFGLADDEFLFLFYFDFHSTPARKNPIGTLNAFRQAFRPDEPVRLVLKSLNGASRPEALEELRAAADGLRVTILDEALDGDDRFRLLRSCDAFVSLHRAEGFGLGMAEAMACGMPVIATDWSGNTDFMNAGNSFPVAYELRTLAQADPPYPAGTRWAHADEADAARRMRQVHDDREATRIVAEQGRRQIAEHHSAAVVGEQIRRRLDRIASFPRREAWADPGVAAEPGMPVRSLAYRGLRGIWRGVLRVTPDRYHPRLHRLSMHLRRKLPVG